MIRVVIDTSVFLRYLIRPSAAVRKLIEDAWVGGQIQLVSAPELIDELVGVLSRPRMNKYVEPVDGLALTDAVSMLADLLPSLEEVPSYTRDAKDDKFIACAILGRAEYVITFDNDILALDKLEGIRMVTPDDFLDCVSQDRNRG